MCRLFAMSAGAERAHATFWLLDAPDSLSQQSLREPDGTGLGWFAKDGTPFVSKQPVQAIGDRVFAHEAREVNSRTFVAHIRYASTGALELRNTHPFKQRGRLFAHNGVIEGLATLEAELGGDMARVRGDTDSERFFALITRETERAGGDVGAGITSAAQWVAQNLPLLAINCVLAMPDGLWALRYPDTHELHFLRTSGEQRQRSSHGMTVQHAGDVVVVASEPMNDDPGWLALTSGELLHVDGSLGVTRETVLSEPPAHPLTLADLSERARASQKPTR